MAKYQRKSYQQTQEGLKKNYDRLLNGVKEVVADPDDYKRYLDFVSKFPTRSARNQLLIFTQKPDAGLVAGLKTWNKFGRQVNKGSKAIKIFAPIIKKEKEIDEKTKQEVEKSVVKGYRMVNVFDVNDTNGVPLPTNPLVPKNVKESEFAKKTFLPLVEELRKELPIVIDENYERSSNGYYSPLEHKIVVNAQSHRDITNQFKTLIHEYAHSIFHNMTGKYKDLDKESKEVQAESVAYLTSKSFGMDTSEYSFRYIKGWADDKDEELLLSFQDDIQKECTNLIRKIENVIIEHNITFDIAEVLETNTTSVEEGEEPISLIKFADTFTIVKGSYNESSLNNLQSIKKLGVTFTDKEKAQEVFETMKGHIPIQNVVQMDKEKGKIHLYERTFLEPNTQMEKKMYFVGVASLTNVKAITNLTSDKELAKVALKSMTLKLGLSENQRIQKDLSSRDLDKDGLTDLQELRTGTNPINPDTDGDGIADNIDTSPLNGKKQSEFDLSL